MSHHLTVRFRVERYLPFRSVKSLLHSPIVARKTRGSKAAFLRTPLAFINGGVSLILLVDCLIVLNLFTATWRHVLRIGNKSERHFRRYQCIPHLQAAAGEPRLYTGFANAEHLRRFGDTELLHVPQYEHGTIFFRE
jgi:hypothetical protein